MIDKTVTRARVLPYIQVAGGLMRIAGPLILASLVSMGISITDVVMMGWLSPNALAAGAAVSDYYSVFFYLSSGVIAAISPLISQSLGGRRRYHIRSITQQGFLLAMAITVPGAIMVWNADGMLNWLGIDASIVELGQPYARMMAFTYFAMMAVNVLHYFLSAHGKTHVILFVTATALPINAFGNYALIFGNFGFPELGILGAGLASLLSASYMFLILLAYTASHARYKRYGLFSKLFVYKYNFIPEIIRVGLPIGLSNLGEMGVFLIATVTMGIFGAEVLAAHTIAIRLAGVLYAFPLGMAQAATVRIGYAVGAGNTENLTRTIRTALGLSISVGIVFLCGMLVLNVQIISWFVEGSTAAQIQTHAVLFLLLLAIIQPFDGVGCVGAGILRGVKDTQVPMIFSMIAFWGVGFAGGWALALIAGLDGLGIWIGLASSVISYSLFIGVRLYWFFFNEQRRMSLAEVYT